MRPLRRRRRPPPPHRPRPRPRHVHGVRRGRAAVKPRRILRPRRLQRPRPPRLSDRTDHRPGTRKLGRVRHAQRRGPRLPGLARLLAGRRPADPLAAVEVHGEPGVVRAVPRRHRRRRAAAQAGGGQHWPRSPSAAATTPTARGPKSRAGSSTATSPKSSSTRAPLSPAELADVRKYLDLKYGGIAIDARGRPRQAARCRVPDPPPVQVLVPGFTARELPVDLTNINNVRYRADGKLVALAYNGNIYLLSDTRRRRPGGHGRAVLGEQGPRCGRPIGMALTPPGYPRGDGVFVASKGKVSLIVDTDGDGKADKEIVVADGLEGDCPHGVDALGVALDRATAASTSASGTHELHQRLPASTRTARPRYDLNERARHDPEGRARLHVARDRRHRHPLPRRPGVQPPRRPVRHRPGGGDLAAQRQPVRRAAAHPAGPALRLPAAAPEAPARR